MNLLVDKEFLLRLLFIDISDRSVAKEIITIRNQLFSHGTHTGFFFASCTLSQLLCLLALKATNEVLILNEVDSIYDY
jgi:hypothetical protein